jgi:hypothetical protein
MNLIHFGTPPEFRIQQPEESQMNSDAETRRTRRNAEEQMIFSAKLCDLSVSALNVGLKLVTCHLKLIR